VTYSREDVERALTLAWPGRWFREVRAAGAGLSGQVFRASSEDWGPIAIKVSPGGIRGNLNDRPKDQRALLIQDAELLEHVRAHGLPAPHPIAVGEAAGLVMLAMEWVENDGSPVPARDLGRLCARLHRVPPPSMQLVEQDYQTVELTVASRLEMRLRGLQALTGESFLSRGRLERVLEAVSRTSRSRPSLLHLDFRPANLLSRHGAVTGIIDWANAMISEPALELARVEEAGLLSEDFVVGYRELMPVQAVEPLRYLGFRLDTAVMLANIFLVEAPDQRLALKQLDRVREVCSRIEAVDSDPKRG
jgi:fructosamine-3-kinase